MQDSSNEKHTPAAAHTPEPSDRSNPHVFPEGDEQVDIDQVCAFWGGNDRPVSRATIYREIKRGRHPKPLKFGRISRWATGELRAERARRMLNREIFA